MKIQLCPVTRLAVLKASNLFGIAKGNRYLEAQAILFDHLTGEWDHVVYFPMAQGH